VEVQVLSSALNPRNRLGRACLRLVYFVGGEDSPAPAAKVTAAARAGSCVGMDWHELELVVGLLDHYGVMRRADD
jgi:hypothetical protein